jgi:pyruvate ferredoxin oxidoreductase gamma subunit
MHEIRIHGRGGQGAVTTGQILAIAAFYDGKQSQTFPSFGVERAGAPVTAFVRIADEKINLRSEVHHPDVVLVLEPTLADVINVAEGVKKGATLIINSNKESKDFTFKSTCTHSVDATKIAMEIFKKPIVNTAVLGAFAAVTNLVTLPSLEKAIDDKFPGKKEIAELNKQAIRRVFAESKKECQIKN